jgi:dolichol-phosphate mannosyltransferase
MGEHVLQELCERVEMTLKPFGKPFELILVEDASPDGSWVEIEKLSLKYDFVRGIKLSRNFGQHYAITAGLDHVQGEWIVVMDCDLQDKPEEILKLYNKSQEGFDVVLALRENRKDSYFKKISSKVFYRTLAWLTGSKQDERIANFGIYHRNVINEIIGMRESIRFFPTMVKWVGFRQTSIAVEHDANGDRKSSYSLGKLLDLGLDIMLAYSDKPVRLTVKLGLIIAFSGFLFAIFTLYKYLTGTIIVAGYASLIISIWVLTGIVLITLGMVGLYVGKTFEGVKERPIYIIEKKTGSF